MPATDDLEPGHVSEEDGLGTEPTGGGHRAAKRALELIEQVASSREPVRLSELARRLGLPKSSAHALARTLDEEGFLERDRRGAYTLGPRLLSLLGRLPDRLQLPRVARPVLQELVEDLGETALVGVRRNTDVVYIEQVETPQFMRYVAPLGEPRPLHCTSIGKVLLAGLPGDEADVLLRSAPLQAFTVYTKVEISSIVAELEAIRRQGFSMNREESVSGVTGVAVPIYEGGRAGSPPLAGVSMVGPTERMATKLDVVPERLMDAAARIGASLKSR